MDRSVNFDDTFLPLRPTPAPPERDDVLRVGAFQAHSRVAGPGLRCVIWVAGCHRRCPGCIKPDLFDFNAGEDIHVSTIIDRIRSLKEITGVTFSGGEPFEQPSALARVAHAVHEMSRDVLVYTGYRIEALTAAENVGRHSLLREVDILVDGEYRGDVGSAGGWRGSPNQRILALTERGRDMLSGSRSSCPEDASVQVSIESDGVRITGCPDRGFLNRLEPELGVRGVTIRPDVRRIWP